MKTRKMKLIAMMITLAAVLTGVNAEAQRREYRSDRSSNERGRTTYHKEARPQPEKREYKSSKRGHKEYQEYSRKGRDYDYHGNKSYKKHGDYAYKHHNSHFDYKYYHRHPDYRYNHPRYGLVYRKFRHTPVRLRHAHGDYFFYSGSYFRYYPEIGYVRIEVPAEIVFATLPFQCDVYRYRGQVYYRHGDIFFERCVHGFRPVAKPGVSIQISAHF